MFKRISIILLILFTLLAFTIGVSATGVFMEKAADASYIRWVKSDGTVILQINEDGTTTYGGTVDYSQTILMETTDQVQFWDIGLNIGATANGALAINSDGTLVTTVTTSYTLTAPIVTITATTRLDHQYDSSNYVRQTVSSAGSVKVLIVGSSDAYEIETGDGAIVLDADTGITLDSGDSTIGIIGDVLGSNAAGPGIIDEAATSTNPTLCPNKADETLGIGWVSANIMSIIIGGGAEYGVSATGIDMNSNALTEMGTYGGTGKVTLTPGAAGTFLDFDLNAAWLGGTLINVDFSASTTPTQAVIGVALDLGTNVVVTAEEDVKAIDINLPQMTVSADTKTIKGIEITATGAMVWSSSGTGTFVGVDITIPAITEGASTTVLASGLKVTGQAITTNGDVYGLLLAGVFTTGIQIGLDGAELDLVLYTDRGISVYNSTDATGGNVMSMYVEMISTGTCKARAAEFVLAPTARLGQWANAVKAYLNLLGAPGGTGTVSSLCVEVLFPDEQQTSSVTVLELEAVVNTGYVYSTYTSVILFQLSGTDSSSFQDGAYFLYVGGLTAATGDMWYGNTLKCSIIGTEWFLPFSSAEDSYTTAYPIVTTSTIATTSTITLTPAANGTYLDFVLETLWVSGTLINADFGSAVTLTGAAVGINLDFSGVHADSDQNIKAIDLTFPDLALDNVSKAVVGVEISGDTITQTTGGSSTWTGIDITIPTLVETAGTLTGYGVKVTGGTCTTDPVTYGVYLGGIFETASIALAGTATADHIAITGLWGPGLTVSAISIGDYSTALALNAGTATTDHTMGIVCHLSGDLGADDNVIPLLVKFTTTGDADALAICQNIYANVNVLHTLSDAYGIRTKLNISPAAGETLNLMLAIFSELTIDDAAVTIESMASAGRFDVNISAVVTTGQVTGIDIDMNDVTVDNASLVTGLLVHCEAAAYVDYGIDIMLAPKQGYMTAAQRIGITQGAGSCTVAIGLQIYVYTAAAQEFTVGISLEDGATVTGIDIGSCTTGIAFTGTVIGSAISMAGITLADGDHEIQMRTTTGTEKTVIASGNGTSDAEIRADVGADASIADGSLYMEITDSGGALWIKKADVWTEFTNP